MEANGLDLGALKDFADQQATQQMMREMTVRQALENPAEIVTFGDCGVALVAEDGAMVLRVGTTMGRRYDLRLRPEACAMLLRELGGKHGGG